MVMTSFTTHIIYEQNKELYLGYTKKVIVESLPEEDIKQMFLKSTTYEKYPLAFKELYDSICPEGKQKNDAKDKIFFKPLAFVLEKKSPVLLIDFGESFDRFWESDYQCFKNLTQRVFPFVEKESRRVVNVQPWDLAIFKRGTHELSWVQDQTILVKLNAPLHK